MFKHKKFIILSFILAVLLIVGGTNQAFFGSSNDNELTVYSGR